MLPIRKNKTVFAISAKEDSHRNGTEKKREREEDSSDDASWSDDHDIYLSASGSEVHALLADHFHRVGYTARTNKTRKEARFILTEDELRYTITRNNPTGIVYLCLDYSKFTKRSSVNSFKLFGFNKIYSFEASTHPHKLRKQMTGCLMIKIKDIHCQSGEEDLKWSTFEVVDVWTSDLSPREKKNKVAEPNQETIETAAYNLLIRERPQMVIESLNRLDKFYTEPVVREKMTNIIRAELEPEVKRQLVKELEPKVKRQLVAELQSDPEWKFNLETFAYMEWDQDPSKTKQMRDGVFKRYYALHEDTIRRDVRNQIFNEEQEKFRCFLSKQCWDF